MTPVSSAWTNTINWLVQDFVYQDFVYQELIRSTVLCGCKSWCPG